MNLLAHGDAADVCAALAPDVSFDLVYLDPPYGVGTSMTARTAPGQTRGKKQASGGPVAYEDRYDPESLVAMLLPRLEVIRGRMSRGATIYVHLDHRTVHEVKVACDRLFGRGAFLGEVIWTPGNGSRGARGFTVTHQTLLLYVRDPRERREVVYNASDPILREPYAATSLEMHFRHLDETGRLYRERVVNGRTYRYYADEGRRLGSVWTDVPAMVANTPLRVEGTGYPTQKPERLLERIIRASSREGATVADLMCGSGTTLVVAAKLGRRFVGGDVSHLAVDLSARRLTSEKIPFVRESDVSFT
ncbi:DNA-methyltransferase [Polyangium jinanense]|uniref:Methyltransferase n=1 Tax=Polyangium jinanense TaxID=2829994 RepID=A0A9X4ASA0_9BACT|nr:site-specific DNA-methyltransferase [Polyangium jinanense]MDC3956026.1 site-specific DNA-methyltransferase [Polyangium jinanense]MDC3982943.1 site-specific DNA-methyltransferase [Polyangium jinanense]